MNIKGKYLCRKWQSLMSQLQSSSQWSNQPGKSVVPGIGAIFNQIYFLKRRCLEVHISLYIIVCHFSQLLALTQHEIALTPLWKKSGTFRRRFFPLSRRFFLRSEQSAGVDGDVKHWAATLQTHFAFHTSSTHTYPMEPACWVGVC